MQRYPAVAVINFGGDKSSSAGDFTIQFPANDANNAIIRYCIMALMYWLEILQPLGIRVRGIVLFPSNLQVCLRPVR